ncbi:MAG: PKD domain-containing protein, partial [Chitinophagales bacterium]
MKKILTQIFVLFLTISPLLATDCDANFEFIADGATVDFFNTSETDSCETYYSWTFGDGSTSTEVNPAHIYGAPGTYTVCLVMESACGCESYKCEEIVIGGGVDCHADFTFTIDGLTVHFDDDSDGSPTSWSWSFGDGGTSTVTNPIHTYAAEGTYNVCLEISTVDGNCMTCYAVTIGGVGECEAAFVFSGDPIVFFDDISYATGTIISWSWSFGDGATSTLENPIHEYDVAGFYNVCLIITTSDGCTSDICHSVGIDIAGGDCSATFDYEVDGATVYFESSTDPGPGDVIEYHWDFGDGSTSSDANPIHTYGPPGTYHVCLTVYFDGGCIFVFCDDVLIVGDADCTAMWEIIDGDSTLIHFYGWVDPEPDEVTYAWDFGDGTFYTETTTGGPSDPWHEYAEPGVYFVCLTITTGDGCVDYYCNEIEVLGGGADDCASEFEFTIDGLTVHFYETATGDVIEYHWDFGDGSISDDANPTHEYGDPGTYNVCLTITTALGCVDYYCYEVTVMEGGGDCESDFEFTEDGLTVHFFETADGGGADIIHYYWTFGDGAVADDPNPDHTYAVEGDYIVCLTIMTADSCFSTYCHEISVEAIGGGGDCHAEFEVISMELTPDGWIVNFENTSTADADIISVVWYFGDGSTATTYDAEHLYADAGTYLICVVITTADGCTSEYCNEIFLDGDEGECEADFEWIADGLTVDFTEDADGGGAGIISYIWSFDDGDAGTGATTTHTYTAEGTYEVCLTIITTDSCIDTHCEEIHIEGDPAPCTAGFEIESITETPDGWMVNFTNTSEGTGPGSETFHWMFGDGGMSEDIDPEHLYTEPGIYIICITIGEDGTECFDEYCEEIFIGGGDDCIDSALINLDEDCLDGDPVCGCDGVTYENACVAQFHHGVMFYTEGACGLTTVEEENIFGGVQLSPNPAQNEVEIKYILQSNADVKIEIVDMIGQRINTIFNETSVAGTYNFHYNSAD